MRGDKSFGDKLVRGGRGDRSPNHLAEKEGNGPFRLRGEGEHEGSSARRGEKNNLPKGRTDHEKKGDRHLLLSGERRPLEKAHVLRKNTGMMATVLCRCEAKGENLGVLLSMMKNGGDSREI